MIISYGISRQGAYHVKNGTVCQDAYIITRINDTAAVAAVADGLGSELYSDIASKIAVKEATGFFVANYQEPMNDEEIIGTIRSSFEIAQCKIEEEAKKSGHEIDQYDTTLSFAFMRDDSLFFGHIGDSGIIAMTCDGRVEKVTEQQRDEYGRVFPLFFGEQKSVFGKFNEKIASVLLATDGILETFTPVLIKDEPVCLYVALARFFMDVKALGAETEGEEGIQRKITEFIDSIPEESVNDDKTVVVMTNTMEINYLQQESYYSVPDWEELERKRKEKWRREAYPHLYADEDAENKSE